MKLFFYSAAMLGAELASALQLQITEHMTLNEHQLFLNQIRSQADETHTCFTTADRARKPHIEGFYDLVGGTNKYSDKDFGHGSSALYWSDMGEADSEMADTERDEKVTWLRASKKFPKATLFGAEGVQVDHIAQGSIGNCWILAALGAVAEYPGRIENLFLNTSNKQSLGGIYGVNLYVLGLPMTITVDDYLPVRTMKDGKKETVFAAVGNEYPLWVSLLEKAFAKRYGNYEHLNIGGISSEAVRTLTGAPYEWYPHNDIDVDELWALLSKHDQAKDFIQVGTDGDGDDTVFNKVGLAQSHAYTVLDVHKLSKSGTRLVKVRNPWGAENFHGAWGDDSPKWDRQSKKEVGFTKANDGVFWIDIESYKENFGDTSINYNVDDWSSAKFLQLNDKSQKKNPGSEDWEGLCGPKCTRHTFQIKSDVEQTVYLTGYSWSRRGIPEDCQHEDHDGELMHGIYVDGKLDNVFVWHYGDYPLPPFTMKAGETVNIESEWNFTNDAHAPDWSITAYGDGQKGSLHLTHDKGLKSHSWHPEKRQKQSAQEEIQEPSKPVPVVPKNPVKPDPVVPKDPVKPVKPDAPIKPEEPAKPTPEDDDIEDDDEPNKPDNPSKPIKPVVPENPEEPEEPDQPEKPKKPVKPIKPVVPENPEELEEPDQPEKPKKPIKPIKPVVPKDPVVPEEPLNPIVKPDKPLPSPLDPKLPCACTMPSEGSFINWAQNWLHNSFGSYVHHHIQHRGNTGQCQQCQSCTGGDRKQRLRSQFRSRHEL